MSTDISIAFIAKDGLSESVNKMRNSTRNLTKDVTDYKKIQEETFNKKVEVKYELTKAKEDLKSLTKAVKENSDGSGEAWKQQQRKILDLENSYKGLIKTAKEASLAEKRLTEDISKSNNSKAASGSNSGVLGSLAKAGMGAMVGNSVSNLANFGASSMFGDRVGNAVGNITGGAAAGAALGSIVPGIGTAIGAGVGALTGALNSLTDTLKTKDGAFKTEVKSLYDNVKQSEANSLNNGSGLANSMEMNKISFTTLLKGENNANSFLKDTLDFAAKTPFVQEDLLKTSKQLLAYGYKQNELIPLLTKIGDATGTLGLKGEDSTVMATSLGRMKNTGKTTLEFLNPLMERGIDATGYLGKAFGIAKSEVLDMVSDGLIPGAEAAQAIADYMGKDFAGGMEKQSKTMEGLKSTLQDSKDLMDMAMGEGYNAERKKGMEKEIETLSGAAGEQMKEANRLIGQYKASLENAQQEEIMKSMDKAMSSSEYQKAKEQGNGAEMGKIIAQAKVEAEIAYKNSEGYKLMQETEISLVKSIQEDAGLNSSYLEFGIRMGEQFSKGLLSARSSEIFAPSGSSGKDDAKALSGYRGNGMAFGSDRIPYDNFPVLLHEGEKVQTRVNADIEEGKKSSGPNINVYADQKIDIDSVVRELTAELIKHNENMGG